MKALIVDNLGAVIFLVLFVLVRKRKAILTKIYNFFESFVILRFRSLLFVSPSNFSLDGDTFPAQLHQSPHSLLHFKRSPFFGVEFLLVKSANLASILTRRMDSFENSCFLYRVLRFGRLLLGVPRDEAENFNTFHGIVAAELKSTDVYTTRDKKKLKFKSQIYEENCYSFYPKYSESCADSGETEDNSPFLVSTFPLIKTCCRELIILLEAKSNRRNIFDVREFSRRHAVNLAGVCIFGNNVQQLTYSKCDFYRKFEELRELWTEMEETAAQKLLRRVWSFLSLGKGGDSCWQNRRNAVVEYFEDVVRRCFDNEHKGYRNCLVYSLVKRVKDAELRRNDHIELITAFVIAYSITFVELMSGITSLILYKISKNVNLQEKIRINDEITFDDEGFPILNFELINQPMYIDSILKETLKKHSIDGLIQLTCTRSFDIPETNVRINPRCVVLIPTEVFRVDDDNSFTDVANENDDTPINNEYGFIVDSETRMFTIFVRKFVDVCVKTSVVSLIHQYEFKTAYDTEADLGVLSCRLSALTKTLPLTAYKVERRGKVNVFEQSLKKFYACKNASFFSTIGL